jgi:hypothetical protein
LERNLTSEAAKIYIASLSKNSVSLAQWRAYADDGRGFCIGLSLENAKHEPEKLRVRYQECIYGEAEFFAAIRTWVDGFLPILIDYSNADLSMQARIHLDKVVHGRARRALSSLATRFKPDAFRIEEEWRLVADRRGSDLVPSFRAGGWGPTPYVSIGFAANPVRELWIGTGPHKETMLAGAEQLLESSGIRRDIIKWFETTHRS